MYVRLWGYIACEGWARCIHEGMGYRVHTWHAECWSVSACVSLLTSMNSFELIDYLALLEMGRE